MNNAKKTKFYTKLERKWVLVDAKKQVCGRLATRIALRLIGKYKATYTPNALCGDRVVVINARHVTFTGNKADKKIYDKYTGYSSGRKEMSLKKLMEKNPSKALYLAIKGMIPKGARGRLIMKDLKIYPDQEHKQIAQQPQLITL